MLTRSIKNARSLVFAAGQVGCPFRAWPGMTSPPPQRTLDRLVLLGELRQGIRRGELEVHYQPLVDLAAGHVTGVEALVRWRHPVRGLLRPDAFLPAAEGVPEVMAELCRSVLAETIRQSRLWAAAGRPLHLAVNLSAPLLLSRGFDRWLLGRLREAELDGSALTLEIIETTVVSDLDRALRTLDSLRSYGVRLALDDFGQGFSSLAYLSHLPCEEIKIDRHFVSRAIRHDRDRVIVEAALAIGRRLGLRTVAEGVEDASTVRWLQAAGCDVGQGFLFAAPMEAAALGTWMQQWPERRRALGMAARPDGSAA